MLCILFKKVVIALLILSQSQISFWIFLFLYSSPFTSTIPSWEISTLLNQISLLSFTFLVNNYQTALISTSIGLKLWLQPLSVKVEGSDIFWTTFRSSWRASAVGRFIYFSFTESSTPPQKSLPSRFPERHIWSTFNAWAIHDPSNKPSIWNAKHQKTDCQVQARSALQRFRFLYQGPRSTFQTPSKFSCSPVGILLLAYPIKAVLIAIAFSSWTFSSSYIHYFSICGALKGNPDFVNLSISPDSHIAC